MICSMKRLKAETAETVPDESRSFEFERLFLEHWASVYRVLYHLVGEPGEIPCSPHESS
jgi:hypothetical protein